MARPFLSPQAFAHRAERVGREAENRDTKKLKDLGERIARQRSKRRRPTEAEAMALFNGFRS